MKYAIVYSSQTGNTRLLAETVRDTLPQEDCVYYGEGHPDALKADRIYVGFWTDKGGCDPKTADFLRQVTGQEIYLFGTAGFGESQDYFDKVLHRTAKNLGKEARLAGSYMCQGKMPMSVRERYEKMMKSPVRPPNLKGLIENFDKALTHPDQHDLDALKAALTRD